MGTSGVKEIFNISRAVLVTRVVICENQCDARQMKLSRLRHGFKGRSSFEEKTYEVQLSSCFYASFFEVKKWNEFVY